MIRNNICEEMIKRAKNGDSKSCYKLAVFFISKRENKKAFEYLMKGIEINSNPYCYFKLGECYTKGIYVDKDSQAADVFYEKAIDGLQKLLEKDKNASFILGLIYSISDKFFDIFKAVNMFKRNYDETQNPLAKAELDKFVILVDEIF